MEELGIRRGPGRPPKADTPTAVSEAAQSEQLPKRPSRKPFGSLIQKLAYADREGFHRHWFNDVPGRVERAKEAGYEHVKSEDGKPVSRNVGVAESGGPLVAYLMEIPEEWYKEDMGREQAFINEKEQLMKRGELTRKEGDGQYVPTAGISISTGRK